MYIHKLNKEKIVNPARPYPIGVYRSYYPDRIFLSFSRRVHRKDPT